MNKYFFSSVKERQVGSFITELYDEVNNVVPSSVDLAQVCNNFYSKSYASLTLEEHKGKCCKE